MARRRNLKPAARHESDLAATIEAALRDDPEVARLTRRILRAQRRLRKVCSREAWSRYLVIEAETNARADHVSHVLLRYGLDLAKRYLEPPR